MSPSQVKSKMEQSKKVNTSDEKKKASTSKHQDRRAKDDMSLQNARSTSHNSFGGVEFASCSVSLISGRGRKSTSGSSSSDRPAYGSSSKESTEAGGMSSQSKSVARHLRCPHCPKTFVNAWSIPRHVSVSTITAFLLGTTLCTLQKSQTDDILKCWTKSPLNREFMTVLDFFTATAATSGSREKRNLRSTNCQSIGPVRIAKRYLSSSSVT